MTYPGQNPHRRRRGFLLALAILVVVAAGAVGLTHWLDTRTTHHPDARSSSAAPSGQVDGCDVTVRAATIKEGIDAGACLLAKIAENQWKPAADQLQVINAAGTWPNAAARVATAPPSGATHRVTTPLGSYFEYGPRNPTHLNLFVSIAYEVHWLQNGLPKTQWCVLSSPITQGPKGSQWALYEENGGGPVLYYCKDQKPDLSLYSGRVPR